MYGRTSPLPETIPLDSDQLDDLLTTSRTDTTADHVFSDHLPHVYGVSLDSLHDTFDFTSELVHQSRDFVNYARNTLHEFLSFDNNRFSFLKSSGDGKRKDSNCLFPPTQAPPQINFKTIGIEKSKRKLLKLLLKIKEEERVENGEMPAFHLLKDCQLLARYVKEEKLPHLVLKLFPADQGYTLSLRRAPDRSNVKSSLANGRPMSPSLPETIRLPYDQFELLSYIDNEELPPMLLDVLDSNGDTDQFLDFFHHGRLFVEVQDYRRNAYASARKHEPRYVMLRPTTQSLLSDLERLAANSAGSKIGWNEQEKLELESRLVLSTADPVCLDPSPMVFLSTNEMQFERKWFKTPPVQRLFAKYSEMCRSQTDKFSQLPAPKGLELFDFLKRKTISQPTETVKRKPNPNINIRSTDKVNQCLPTGLMDEVRKHSRVIEMPTRNDNSLTKLEEYVLEFTESEKISTITTISIFYRQIDDIYFGQLSVEKANPLHHHHHHRTLAEQLHNAKVSSNLLSSSTGSSCLFQLGSKMLTKKYVEQFIEILSEHGRKAIKITTKKPGEAHRTTYTRKPATISTQSNQNDTFSPKRLRLNSCSVNGNLTNRANSATAYIHSTNLLQAPLSKVAASAPLLTSQLLSQPLSAGRPSSISSSSTSSSWITINGSHSSPNTIATATTSAATINNCVLSHESNASLPPQLVPLQSVTTAMSHPQSTQITITSGTTSSSTPTSASCVISSSPSSSSPSLSSSSSPTLSSTPNNSLIANNPILNNLITNSNGGTSSLLTGCSLTVPTTLTSSSSSIKPLSSVGSSPSPAKGSSIEATITPISLCTPLRQALSRPIISNASNHKTETLAVILTTNPLHNASSIGTSATFKCDSIQSQPVMQISSSGAHLQAMNNTNASNLPAGVNISSLSLAKSPNVRLHNLVSLTNMQGATQCIALPISLMMSPVSASSSTVTVQSASGAGTIASSAASLLTTSTNSNGIVLGTLDDKKATLDSSACGSTLINSHTNSVTLSTGHSSVHPSPTLPPPVGQTVLLIENSNGNEMQLLQPSTGSSNLLHNNSTGQVVTSQLNNANLLSAINVSTGMNLHQSLSTTSGHSISLLSNASTKPATISSRTTSALSTSAHLLGSLQAGPLSADYAKGLISKQPNKFTGSGQLQIQLGGKSISAEPNATTIQLTSGTRVHLPKSSHLPTQLLLQPSSGSASVTSSQLISRKMNHK